MMSHLHNFSHCHSPSYIRLKIVCIEHSKTLRRLYQLHHLQKLCSFNYGDYRVFGEIRAIKLYNKNEGYLKAWIHNAQYTVIQTVSYIVNGEIEI